MSKYLILLIVAVGMMTGCADPKKAEQKGFVEGCSAMAHDLLDPQGAQINDAKLEEYCLKMAQKSLK